MATTVYEVKELTLQDGSTVTCKPANIKVMRKGQELIRNLGAEPEEGHEDEHDETGIRPLLDIVCLCLKRERPEFQKTMEVENDDGSKTSKTVTDYDLMEELFDLDTVFEVIYLYLGIKLNDPKLVEAAAQMAILQAQAEESSGQSSNSQT